MQIEFTTAAQRGNQPITAHPNDPTLCYTWSKIGGAKKNANGDVIQTYGCTACSALHRKDTSIFVPNLKAVNNAWAIDPVNSNLKHACDGRNRAEIFKAQQNKIQAAGKKTKTQKILTENENIAIVPSTSNFVGEQPFDDIIFISQFFIGLTERISDSIQKKLPSIETAFSKAKNNVSYEDMPTTSSTILSASGFSFEHATPQPKDELFDQMCKAFGVKDSQEVQSLKEKYENSVHANSDNLFKLKAFLDLFMIKYKEKMQNPNHPFHFLTVYANEWNQHLNGAIESSTELESDPIKAAKIIKLGVDSWKSSLSETLIEICKTIDILYKLAEETEKDFTSFITPDHVNSLVMLDVVNLAECNKEKALIKKEGKMSSLDWYFFFKSVNQHLQNIGQKTEVKEEHRWLDPNIDEEMEIDFDPTCADSIEGVKERLENLERRKEILENTIENNQMQIVNLKDQVGDDETLGECDLRDIEIINLDSQTLSDEEIELISLDTGSTPTMYIKFPTTEWKIEAIYRLAKQKSGIHAKSFVQPKEPVHLYDKRIFDPDLSSMQRIDVKRDGNTGFRALSWFLYGDERFHVFVRQDICTHLMVEESFVKALVEKQYSNQTGYIADSHMLNNNVWMTNVELHAAAHLYDMHILVYESENGNWVHYFPLKPYEWGDMYNASKDQRPSIILYHIDDYYQPVTDPFLPEISGFAHVFEGDDDFLEQCNIDYDQKVFNYDKDQFENDRKYSCFKKEHINKTLDELKDIERNVQKLDDIKKTPELEWGEVRYEIRKIGDKKLWEKETTFHDDTIATFTGIPDNDLIEKMCKNAFVFMSEDTSVPGELKIGQNFKIKKIDWSKSEFEIFQQWKELMELFKLTYVGIEDETTKEKSFFIIEFNRGNYRRNRPLHPTKSYNQLLKADYTRRLTAQFTRLFEFLLQFARYLHYSAKTKTSITKLRLYGELWKLVNYAATVVYGLADYDLNIFAQNNPLVTLFDMDGSYRRAMFDWNSMIFSSWENIISQAVRDIITQELNGGQSTTLSIPLEVFHSYKILGLLNPNRQKNVWANIQKPEIGPDFLPILQLQPISPHDHSKFIEWHLTVYPSLKNTNGFGVKSPEELRRQRKNENNKRYRDRKKLIDEGKNVPEKLKRQKVSIEEQEQTGTRTIYQQKRRENNRLAKQSQKQEKNL